MWANRDNTGTSGDFKVQLYDLETEANGMLTYDRAVWKVDPAVVNRAARGELFRPNAVDLLPCSLTKQVKWRYTTEQPAEGWNAKQFNADSWREGLSAFGSPTGQSRVGAAWNSPEIWLRCEFTLDSIPKAPFLRMLHDEDVTVWINGVPACKAVGFITSHGDFDIRPEAAATLKTGRNTVAVHCRQTTGGQHIDVGLLDIGSQ